MLSTLVAAVLLAAAPPVSSSYPTQADYLRILQRFPRYAERGWHVDQRGPGLGWFGDGRSDENGQRTLANFVLTYAWLATRPDYDPTPSGVSQAVIRDHALAALRYRLRTHVTGDLTCSDGKSWGDHWQSAWWVSRMLGGADLLRPFLTADDQQRLEAMVVHEADRHIGLPPRVGEYGDTKSEENAWDSEVLAWALCLYPDDPDAAAWREAFNRLCLNTLAVEADLTSAKEVEGRPLSEWVGGASVHPDYTIENHGYFHICYMVCPQHSFAWDYYVFRRFGQEPPAAIYHHTRDVWRRTKQFFLWDNRFAYVGGKDWPRYAYGMYFVLPALVHYQHAFGDRDARLIEQRRVAAFEQEQLHWNDGSFFSGRFTRGLMERWPSEWETDCAANLTIAALLHGTRAPLAPTPAADLAKRNEGTFLSPYSQLAMRRDPQRFAAWAWKSHAGPVSGMVCSDRGEHLLEWDRSLAGSLDLAGAAPRVAVESQRDVATPGGFRSEGIIGHGLVAAEPSPYRLTVVDDNVRTQTIRVPSHPIFTTPHRVESVAGLTDLDSVTAAGTGWTALATNTRGGPSLLEAKVGQGTFLLSMTNVEQRLTEGDATATALLQNIMAYLGAAKGRCAYLAGESWLANALDRLDVTFTTVRPSWRLDLQGYDVLFIDRSAATAIPVYPAILDFVRRGGRVFSSIIQDTGWLPDAIATIPPVAVRQHVLFTPARRRPHRGADGPLARVPPGRRAPAGPAPLAGGQRPLQRRPAADSECRHPAAQPRALGARGQRRTAPLDRLARHRPGAGPVAEPRRRPRPRGPAGRAIVGQGQPGPHGLAAEPLPGHHLRRAGRRGAQLCRRRGDCPPRRGLPDAGDGGRDRRPGCEAAAAPGRRARAAPARARRRRSGL